MRLEDMGIDPETKRHDSRLTHAESVFVGILWTEHVGQENKMSADNLAREFTLHIDGFVADYELPARKREVRKMHNHLLMDHRHIPIMSKAGPGGGYWIAEDDHEAAEFYHTFRKRGMTGLVKASRGQQAAMVDMMQQLSFEFHDLVDASGMEPRTSGSGMPVPVEVVDSFLGKMLEDPEKFSDGIKRLRDKYGSVLISRDSMKAIQDQAARLQDLVEGIGI